MLHRISQILQPLNQSRKELSAPGLKFKPGEIIKGTVLKNYSEGEVLISAGGKEFRAFSGLRLMEGSTHQFQVLNAGAGIELKVLDKLIREPGSPLQLWVSHRSARDELAGILSELIKNQNATGLPKGIEQGLSCLEQLFPAVIFRNNSEDKGQWFSRFIMGSGMFWENKVFNYLTGNDKKSINNLMMTDLKGILLVLRKHLLSGEIRDGQMESLSSRIQNAISLIEQDQLLNLSSLRDGMGWFCFIPVFREEGFNRAELFVEDRKSNDEIRFYMLLDFTLLGQVEAEVSVIKSTAGIRISVESSEKADYVRENLPLLETALKEAGLVPGSIVCNAGNDGKTNSNPFTSGNRPSVHIVI